MWLNGANSGVERCCAWSLKASTKSIMPCSRAHSKGVWPTRGLGPVTSAEGELAPALPRHNSRSSVRKAWGLAAVCYTNDREGGPKGELTPAGNSNARSTVNTVRYRAAVYYMYTTDSR